MVRIGRLAGFALVAALAGPAAAEPSKEFRDYLAWCSSGMTCSARVDTKDNELSGFGIERVAGRNTPVTLFLDISAEFAKGSDVSFSVDGKSWGVVPASQFTRDEDDYRSMLQSQESVSGLIAVLRNGRRLDVSYSGTEGQRSVNISLAGLAASLTWLDDVQGRVGTRDAIVAKGDEESPEFTARDITTVEDLPEAIREDFTGEGECAFFEPDRFGRAGGFEDRFDKDNALLVVPCADGGAYNQPFSLYWVTAEGVHPMQLPTMGELGPMVIEEAWNVGWDGHERVLEAFFKGRGIGDCGLYDKWKLIGVPDSLQFMLIEERSKDDCDGEGGLETFPYLWPPKRK